MRVLQVGTTTFRRFLVGLLAFAIALALNLSGAGPAKADTPDGRINHVWSLKTTGTR